MRQPAGSDVRRARGCSRAAAAAVAAAVVLGAGAMPGAASVPHATGAARPTCSTVSITLLDHELAIAAAHVNSVRRGSSGNSLICSYFGSSGGYRNEATIVYLTATPAEFTAIVDGLSKTHRVVRLGGIADGAYSYAVSPETFLYMLDGTSMIELYAAVSLARLEALARRITPLVRT